MTCAHHELACSSCGKRWSPPAPPSKEREHDGVVALADEIHIDGKVIHFTFAGSRASLPRLAGLDDVAFLIFNQGKYVPADTLYVRLLRRLRAPCKAGTGESNDHLAHAREKRMDGIHDDVVMDAEALEAAREQIARYREEGRDSEAEALEHLIQPVLNYKGRSRTFVDPSHRSRVAVQKRMKAALKDLERALPALWEHLGGAGLFAHDARRYACALRTGAQCIYAPTEPHTWLLAGCA